MRVLVSLEDGRRILFFNAISFEACKNAIDFIDPYYKGSVYATSDFPRVKLDYKAGDAKFDFGACDENGWMIDVGSYVHSIEDEKGRKRIINV